MNSPYIYRINEFSIIRTSDWSVNNSGTYLRNKYTTPISTTNLAFDNQWIEVNPLYGDTIKTRINQTTVYGNPLFPNQYKRVNYMTFQEIENLTTKATTEHPSIRMSLLIRQGFNWRNTFGLLLVIQDISNPNVPLISRLLRSTDFMATTDKELIYGVFWLEEFIFNIPYSSTMGNIAVGIEVVSHTDINNTTVSPYYGMITNYPVDLIPLIDEVPVPDNILVDIDFGLMSHLLKIHPKTNNGDTVRHAIYDYFNIKDDQIINISVQYYITYGYNEHYESLVVSNDYDMFGDISIGLDFRNILQQPDGTWASIPIEIFVVMEININNKIIRRENRTNSMNITSQLNQYIIQNIGVPQTINPVKYEEIKTINYDIIKVQERRKIIPMYQYIFAELIDTQLIYEKKNIKFDNVTFPAYLKVNKSENDKEQMLLNDKTSDGTYYFDLVKLEPLTQPTTYELIKIDTDSIIGKGDIILKN
jgi:hypothetical protein